MSYTRVMRSSILFPMFMCAAMSATAATTLNVGTTADGTGTSPLTLRAAITKANNDANAADFPYIINLPTGTYTLTSGELALGDSVGSGLGNNVIITGQAGQAALTTINTSAGTSRLFLLDPLAAGHSTFSFANLTLANGTDTALDTYGFQGQGGGAVLTGDEGIGGDVLNMTNCIVINNKSTCSSGGLGGAGVVSYGGNVTLIGCTFSNNVVSTGTGLFEGGAVCFNGQSTSDTLNARQCAFFANSITGSGTSAGGALAADTSGASSSEKISSCVFLNNTAQNGGGIYLTNIASVADSITACTFGTNGTAAIYSKTPSLNVNNCRFFASLGTGRFGIDAASGSVGATENWWGANGSPASAVAGIVTYTPYLTLTLTTGGTTIGTGVTNIITASVLTDSSGSAVPVANLQVLTNLPVKFTFGVSGSIISEQPVIEPGGTATANYLPTAAGTVPWTAQVDNDTASVGITVVNSASTVKVSGITATNASVGISGGPGLTYSVQASQDLKTWTTLALLLIPSGGTNFYGDPNARSFPYRFYRVVYP